MTAGPTFPGVILAGGLSRRMGENKANVMLSNRPLLHHIIERLQPQVSLLAINSNIVLEAEGYPLLADDLPDRPGPLAGIAAAMRFAAGNACPHVLTAPVDCPFLPTDLVSRLASGLEDAETIAVASSGGRLHPVAALWPTGLGETLHRWLSEGESRRVTDFLAQHRVVPVNFTPTSAGALDPFFNINTRDDLAIAEAALTDES
ncbi:molybdenum cofactor guanylyltransferase MobA [Rhizobium paknamense]|uniref:Molybdenum cofactor guanylyltransferase n=1 Tax=Rhizobium paknamense TaxID=1206817 RepID=A0ABU0I6N0_9HYPH|nr:molybdenum cofactor guanylyltransferase MobA [Rhizobium paknamense]MDQ0453880.1 molybdopterin-guanine dinucleotide biosynthesis protein A [Rhizobium paknamense]